MEKLEHSLQASDQDAVSIRHIPADVLRLVFSEYVDIPGNAQSLLRATNLTMVCHTWRAIALDTAELWTEIKLFLNQYLPPLSAISTVLALSRRQPIDIYLRIDGHSRRPGHAYWCKVIELVWEHQERWRSFDLDYFYDPHRSEGMDLKLQGTLPYLRFLQCNFQSDGITGGDHEISISVHNFVAPRVHDLTLGRYVNRIFTPTDLSHSFLSLESLLLDSPHHRRESRVEILRALAHLPKLQVLQLVSDGGGDSPTTQFDPSSPICLSSLREFTITSSGKSAITEWLAIFRAPSLMTIAISSCSKVGTRGIGTFNVRFPSLRTMYFDIRYQIEPIIGYAELSRYAPVIEFEIGGDWNLMYLMRILRQKQNGTYLYPSLYRLEIHSSLHLGQYPIDNASIEALCNFVKTRSWMRARRKHGNIDTFGATLREVHIRISGDMTQSLREWFERNLVSFTCSSTILQDLQMDSVRLVNGEEE
ncbi:uncharacterized protein LAESUDRAFT_352814 [Laetiporus sulphureus 93-53]|uniref:Uncharacterized protein n=1 Tax=Laetiporus sulphureus 93-53 TaxID=1314785 RepID=A0A165GV15_9APHY|nr:uncharacterized protein LAESUDRAFT_352814 [Laetiporus sulphureus 93-53]KZT10853.1 hypothetical protein LAESUDRAFT_352814 [Laetiporus sulphureus 93-53]